MMTCRLDFGDRRIESFMRDDMHYCLIINVWNAATVSVRR